MNRKLSEDELFEDILERTERQFKAAVSSTETDIQVVLRAQFDDLKATFDIVRNDNAISEGEQDPVFRVRIQNALESCRKTAERHQAVLEGIQT